MDRLRYLLGVLTLVVMVAGGWFLFRQLRSDVEGESFTLQVTFLDARGLKAGADVKYRGIQVGSVRGVDVDDEGLQAVVRVTILPDHVGLLRTNSRFWIVTPRFHGLQGGVSGLDTLVRDVYLAFLTPAPLGEPLVRDSGLSGEEAPFVPAKPVGRGDLLLRVLLPENHGIAVGAPVMFRGMATGEVRSIALVPTGTHVEVQARIDARYRSTVTDASVFWVAKPDLNLKMSLTNPVAVSELGALIRPYLAYYTDPKTGVPVHDNYPVAAGLNRPAFVVTSVPAAALARKPEMVPTESKGPVTLVRIIYEAIDVDYISPNDTLRRESTGMLFVDKKGRTLILATRSGCDADYFYRETFGEKATIESEKIAVQLPGSNVLTARRIWPQPDGLDLVVLEVQGLPRNYPTTKATAMSYPAQASLPVEGLTIHVAGELGVAETPETLDLKKVNLTSSRGGVIFHSGKAVAILGQIGDAEDKIQAISLVALPDDLRPVE